MTKQLLILFTGIITYLLLCVPAFAEKFYIENYDVNINVNKSKQAHIIETIDVYFTDSAHGIYRDIPHNNATITNIRISENSQITYNGKNVNIKIGDPDRMIRGKHSYTISYNYNYFD